MKFPLLSSLSKKHVAAGGLIVASGSAIAGSTSSGTPTQINKEETSKQEEVKEIIQEKKEVPKPKTPVYSLPPRKGAFYKYTQDNKLNYLANSMWNLNEKFRKDRGFSGKFWKTVKENWGAFYDERLKKDWVGEYWTTYQNPSLTEYCAYRWCELKARDESDETSQKFEKENGNYKANLEQDPEFKIFKAACIG
ncbi:hypothetical protein [Candidatus Mycoplasma haematohominis]|uniref:hypothetical protein n=1 Tax=Candidatus Mycoplasma haematohominis TaxID=1494318 RepID=UPI001C0A752B|nr:hypothetical protein [Candidatus Mycoplasma haemohominis]